MQHRAVPCEEEEGGESITQGEKKGDDETAGVKRRKGKWICDKWGQPTSGAFVFQWINLFPEAQLKHRRWWFPRIAPPPRVLTQRAPHPSLAQERPGDMHGMPEQTCFCHHLKHPPARLQSGPEVPLGRGHGHSLPAWQEWALVSKVTQRVMARTVSSMLTVVLVAVGLAPGDGKLETLTPKPWTCRCAASSRAPLYSYFTYNRSVDLKCIH